MNFGSNLMLSNLWYNHSVNCFHLMRLKHICRVCTAEVNAMQTFGRRLEMKCITVLIHKQQASV